MDTADDIIEQQIFWNRIMADHSKFISGFLDPTEVDLINIAENFGKEFDELTAKAVTLTEQMGDIPEITEESRNAAVKIKDFKILGTQGVIGCKIKSIAMPLLGDHVVREANHFIRLLNSFKR